ncbi:MAG: hypothetical protein HOV80_32430 [Polyangiaceae bacterium]|nr:hypothetical protein [Polyangiaceae bacterium]
MVTACGTVTGGGAGTEAGRLGPGGGTREADGGRSGVPSTASAEPPDPGDETGGGGTGACETGAGGTTAGGTTTG